MRAVLLLLAGSVFTADPSGSWTVHVHCAKADYTYHSADAPECVVIECPVAAWHGQSKVRLGYLVREKSRTVVVPVDDGITVSIDEPGKQTKK